MPTTPEAHMAAMIANMPKQTGRTLEEWIQLLRSSGLTKFGEQVSWLKKSHGLGHGAAQVVAWESAKGPEFVEPSPEEWLADQYSGAKAALLPVYERLVAAARSLGDDVTLRVCKTYVAISRELQFAVIQPSTKTRVDLGLSLPDADPTGRLQTAKNVGSGRTTHQIALAAPAEVDAEVLGWLKTAYESGKSR